MISGLAPANAFFAQILKGNADNSSGVGGRIYPGFVPTLAPGVAVYPNQTYAFVSGTLTKAMGGEIIQVEPLFLVRVNGKGTLGEIGSIADGMNALLHGAEVQVTVRGVTYDVCCQMEREHERNDFNGNEQFAERGGYFRLYISES
jgi:hypothetical protein